MTASPVVEPVYPLDPSPSVPVTFYEYPPEPGDVVEDCRECLPWCAEFALDGGFLVVREWHAASCSVVADENAPTG